MGYNLICKHPKKICPWKTWSTCSVEPKSIQLLSTRESFTSPEKMKVHLVRTSSESSVLMISNHSEHACLLMETMKTCASTQRISLTNALILLSEKSTRLEQETMSTE